MRMIRKSAMLILILGLTSCNTEMLKYREELSTVIQSKSDAITKFRVFDCQHQLKILLSTNSKTPSELLAEYRSRRSVIEQLMITNAQDDLALNTQLISSSDRKMKELSDTIFKKSVELASKIDDFIASEQKLLSTTK